MLTTFSGTGTSPKRVRSNAPSERRIRHLRGGRNLQFLVQLLLERLDELGHVAWVGLRDLPQTLDELRVDPVYQLQSVRVRGVVVGQVVDEPRHLRLFLRHRLQL